MLRPLLVVAAAQVVLSALGAVQTALLTRTLRFDQLTKTGIVSSLVSGGLGVAFALAGWGVWSLAVQVLAMAAIGSLSLWLVSDWRPALRFRISAIRHLFGFGVFVSLSSLLEVLFSNGFALVVGKLYGVRDLGILNRAHGVQALPTGIISAIISRTALPLFAARASDPEALKRGFKMSLSLAMLLSLPMMAGLALLPDLVILILFGEKWMPSAPLLGIIALAGMLMPLHVLNIQLLLAQGNSRAFFKLDIYKKIAGILCLGVGSYYGIYGIAYASLLFSPIAFIINAAPAERSIGYGALKQLWGLRGTFFATFLMSCAVLAAKGRMGIPPILELAALSALGLAVYLGAGFLLKLPSFLEAHSMAALLLKRSPATSGLAEH
jgi:O-antigen/teichoic acid export membrane protein